MVVVEFESRVWILVKTESLSSSLNIPSRERRGSTAWNSLEKPRTFRDKAGKWLERWRMFRGSNRSKLFQMGKPQAPSHPQSGQRLFRSLDFASESLRELERGLAEATMFSNGLYSHSPYSNATRRLGTAGQLQPRCSGFENPETFFSGGSMVDSYRGKHPFTSHN